MKAASSGLPSGAGLSFLRFSMAARAMPLFGPCFDGKSKSTTGTLALMQCAAICAPITPAPKTATFSIMRLFTNVSPRAVSKEFGIEREQVARARPCGKEKGLGLGEEAAEIEARGRQLGHIKGIGSELWIERDASALRPEVAEHEVADQTQIVRSGGAHLVGALLRFAADFHRKLLDFADERAERSGELGHPLALTRVLDEALHDDAQPAELDAAVEQHLATQQIERLNAIGALVDRVDAGIAYVLIHAPFPNVPVAAEHLQREIGARHAVVGEERLDHRRQQRH